MRSLRFLVPVFVLIGALLATPAEAGWGGGGGGGGGGCANSGCTTPFAVALPIPPVLTPTSTDATTDYYTITEEQADASIIPGHTTPVWTYNGLYPGPTIKATSGRTVKVHVTNNLPENTVMHLHGTHSPASSDGSPGPANELPPGTSYDYTYPNQQSARTEWYHDHAMDLTGAHVYKGLAGFYLITDDQEQSFNLPSGSNDIPVVLQDRTFNADGTLNYSLDRSSYRKGFMSDTQLVNGAPQPYLRVATRKVRLRVLNGSNARYYELRLSNGQSMTEIGNEGGLFSAPLQMSSITLAPAERADFIIDFSEVPVGTSVTLQNGRWDSIGDLIRFDVATAETDTSTIPSTLRPFTPIPPSQSTVSRTFRISQDNGVWVFNGLGFDPNRIDAHVALNATETWTFDNRSGQDHPIHVHLVNFQVLSIDGSPPPPDQAQWKETVNVPSWSTVRVIAKFTDFAGTYVFHCHILEHEDVALMGQFNVS
ncbi:MAG TPA: multicopper oxidase domain-containing protein [Actinomycetota bacterium]|jgi:spore coat protein A|nr:multicopper oxidase domain-containing protein [Actinomycetota bacterium]